MDSRGVDHARLYLDPTGASGQLRPPCGGDLCRSTDASTLYHSRYLASMPITTGSSFPFLGGMFTGSLPGPPTSPFRTPTTPGVNNMRQFWPPTPPPDGGYGRYSMNTNLFPLFGTPSPEGAFLTQGLVSRLGSTTHLSPLIDHKGITEHNFFSHGIGLGSPLTPNSHVTSSSPFPHLIPSLERHPAYGGHMTLGTKELEDLQHDVEDSRLMKGHYDCGSMKSDIPSPQRPKSKNDKQHCCDNKLSEDCCKLSPSCISHDKSHEDIKSNYNKSHNRHLTNKVQPCKIEVNHSPSIKTDLLSPPIESPKSDGSPSKTSKRSPFVIKPSISPAVTTSYPETRCSQCCANIKDVDSVKKLHSTMNKEIGVVTSQPVVTLQPSTNTETSQRSPVCSSTLTSNMNNDNISPIATTTDISGNSTSCNQKALSSSLITLTTAEERSSTDQSLYKLNKSSESCSKPVNTVAPKHVTAAVIPTAPKQTVHRDVHPDTLDLTNIDHTKNGESSLKEQSRDVYSDNNINTELTESTTEKTQQYQSNNSISTNGVFSNRSLNKNLSTSCKVKDIIKNTCSAKQQQQSSPSKKVQQDIFTSKASEMESTNVVISSSVPVQQQRISQTIDSLNAYKNSYKTETVVPFDNIIRKCSPFPESSPAMKSEVTNAPLDCEFTQKSNSTWTKATVSPFNWQTNNSQSDQAINLTVSKKIVKPEPKDAITIEQTEDIKTNIKIATENTTISSGIIGVCHPNPNPIPINKIKPVPALSSISNFASISVLNQPTEQSTEVHIIRSSKSSYPIVNRNGTSPVPLKSTISHVTANTSTFRSMKTERLTSKRGKISDMEKVGHTTGRSTLATLAPKLSKNINFGKDGQTSHTISSSSSVSSTSIVFPATVNPCIPVGIAIAQQRQDSSTTASLGKHQSPVQSNTPNLLTTNTHMSANRVQGDLQSQEILRDQKNQELPISSNLTPVESNLLVTQGPTMVSRQWESDALTRASLPSSGWVTHGSIVAPAAAVWLGQGAYAAAPPSNAVQSVAVNPLEPSLSLPPGGYQLARDSMTGHLLLIPTANIGPIQQLLTQQQHQFEQVMPLQTDSLKSTDGIENSCNITTCDISSNATVVKPEEKMEDVSGQVPSVPLATGQTYAFTTFPTPACDPSGFSYVLQSSTVMHLAHTQTTSSIQSESGRRSQATSPLHCATPSPPPNAACCSVQVSATEDEESESDDGECCETFETQSPRISQSVTTAIQVDMDSQTNSEEDEDEERKVESEKSDLLKVNMSDSANQTESVLVESPKSDPNDNDIVESIQIEKPEIQSEKSEIKVEIIPLLPVKLTEPEVVAATISIKDDILPAEPGLEIVSSEMELAPSLPVESKPVMDFIDHHGLNLLVDSIEEFASREQEANDTEKEAQPVDVLPVEKPAEKPEIPLEPIKVIVDQPKETSESLQKKSFLSPFKTIDASCTDGLGLLCALAEQRFFEEAFNDDQKSSGVVKRQDESNYSAPSQDVSLVEDSRQSFESSAQSSGCSSPSSRDVTETEMRLQIEELQKKYKQKQRELELLRNKREKEEEELMRSKNAESLSQVKSFVEPSSQSIESQKLSEFTTDIISSENKNFQENVAIENESKSSVQASSNLVLADKATLQTVDANLNSSDSSSDFSERSSNLNDESLNKSIEQKSGQHLDHHDYDKNDKSKTPFFDEQAWFVRRSERIFLSDARAPPTTKKSSKKLHSHTHRVSIDGKEKKEHKFKEMSHDGAKKHKSTASKTKSSTISKSDSSSESDSEDQSSEVESCSDAASSTSENLPLSSLVDSSPAANKGLSTLSERQKRISTDSSEGQSEDLPLCALLEPPSCILKPEDLQENARLLVLDEGLFYAGHITKNKDPDMYGIVIDGDRAARPHLFSKEEILNAAVLEVKPSHKQQLPEGSRICAFWSQQYRCLYPGTVTKASSPLPDPSLLFVEFDDGDSGRIDLRDIRMLPSDFPIVSMEPNPFMILGKRRSRAQSQNNNSGSETKTSCDSQKNEKEKLETKKHKNSYKLEKKDDRASSKDKSKDKTKSIKSSKNYAHESEDKNHNRQPVCKELSHGGEIKKKKHSEKKLQEDNAADSSSSVLQKPKKHKKHKEDHHKHHHHHHKHHHHKKHKAEKSERSHHSFDETVIHSSSKTSSGNKIHSNSLTVSANREQEYDSFILENSKSDLTMKIKKSPSPHTGGSDESTATATLTKREKKKRPRSKEIISSSSSSSSSDEDDNASEEEPPKKKVKKSMGSQMKRKDRVPSVEKSKIAAFLPVRQLWSWSGKSYKRPGVKGKAKKEFYRTIQRGKEIIRVGDCAVFLSTGRPHLPYIGRIETMWESWGGKMDVKVKWFYHPEETKSGKKLSVLKGALFQSPHFDENDVQTISHKCEVLSWGEFQQRVASESNEDNNDTYFLAGTYDPIVGTLVLEPGVPNITSCNMSDP